MSGYIFPESVRLLMADIGRDQKVSAIRQQLIGLYFELHNLTGENPPFLESKRLALENERFKRVINLQNQLIAKLRQRAQLFEMDQLECDILNELAKIPELTNPAD
jgi:hypothetical protein